MTDERSEWEKFSEDSLPRMLAEMQEALLPGVSMTSTEFRFDRDEPAAKDYKHNTFAVRMEDLSSLHWYGPTDTPFRNYTPFPKFDAAERKARAAAIEGRERLVAAWKVLRSGDRDPFGEGCDRCGW